MVPRYEKWITQYMLKGKDQTLLFHNSLNTLLCSLEPLPTHNSSDVDSNVNIKK